MYAIMNRELNAYSHGPSWDRDIFDDYERKKTCILAPEHWMYGSKLVFLKRVKTGIEIKFLFSWRRWRWKPDFSWKYSQYFSFLFLTIWFNFDYGNRVDKVLKDHLMEG